MKLNLFIGCIVGFIIGVMVMAYACFEKNNYSISKKQEARRFVTISSQGINRYVMIKDTKTGDCFLVISDKGVTPAKCGE